MSSPSSYFFFKLFTNLFCRVCRLLGSWLKVLSFDSGKYTWNSPDGPCHPFTSPKCVPPVGVLWHNVPPLLRILGHPEGPTLLIGALFRKSCGRGIVFIHFLPQSFLKACVDDKCSCCGEESGVRARAGWWKGARRCTWWSERGRFPLADLRCWHLIPLNLMKPGSLLLVKVIRVTTQGRPEATARGVDVMSPHAHRVARFVTFLIIRGEITRWANAWGGCLAWNVYVGLLWDALWRMYNALYNILELLLVIF